MKLDFAARVRTCLELLGILPTTQFRVVVSAIPILATTARYTLSHTGWSPSYEWLGFLLLLAGVDTIHFLGKRSTDAAYVAAKNGHGANGERVPPAA